MIIDFLWRIFGGGDRKISNFINTRRVVDELFHADRQTDWRTDKKDMTNLSVAYRNFANGRLKTKNKPNPKMFSDFYYFPHEQWKMSKPT